MRRYAIRSSMVLVTILLLPLLVLVAQETSALLVQGRTPFTWLKNALLAEVRARAPQKTVP